MILQDIVEEPGYVEIVFKGGGKRRVQADFYEESKTITGFIDFFSNSLDGELFLSINAKDILMIHILREANGNISKDN